MNSPDLHPKRSLILKTHFAMRERIAKSHGIKTLETIFGKVNFIPHPMFATT